MVKIPLGSDYTYDYKRIGKIAYGNRPTQTIIPNHSRLYPMINFVPRADPKLIKEMFEYSFLNLIYVSDDCREIKELLEKITEAVNELKRISKIKEMIFIKILTTCTKTVRTNGIQRSRWFKLELAIKKLVHLLI